MSDTPQYLNNAAGGAADEFAPEEATSRVRRPGSPPAQPSWERGKYPDDPRLKSPTLALLLSGMPGVGQIYLGYYQQGFLNIAVVASIITILASDAVRSMEPLLGLFLAFYWIYNMVDAWRRAHFYNNALAGIGAASLPDDLGLPKWRGSLVGGVGLILVGLVLWSNTYLGVSLEWVERWWPGALVIAGAWLIYQNVKSRKAQPPSPQA